MNYMKIDECDVANGKKFGVVFWVSGCGIHCPGCHNQCTWDYDAGYPFTSAVMDKLMKAVKKPFIKRITFSGGHPLDERNIETVKYIIERVRKARPDIEIWLYTGYNLQVSDFIFVYNLSNKDIVDVNAMCDFVVDGSFIQDCRDITIAFRGSTNQRIINVKKTIEKKQIVTENYD